jgi:hypothetical protein
MSKGELLTDPPADPLTQQVGVGVAPGVHTIVDCPRESQHKRDQDRCAGQLVGKVQGVRREHCDNQRDLDQDRRHQQCRRGNIGGVHASEEPGMSSSFAATKRR